MSILKHLLVPIDASKASARALDYALLLAESEGADLTFCNAVDVTGMVAECTTPYAVGDLGPLLEALEIDSRSLLRTAQEKARLASVKADGYELAGPAVAAITQVALSRCVSAIVMGTHGRSGASHLFLGSTAEGVLRSADLPVFVVQDEDRVSNDPLARIVVAVDDSDPADAAVEFALNLAHPAATTIILAHVVPTPHQLASARRHSAKDFVAEETADAVKRFAAATALITAKGVAVETELLQGATVHELLKLATARDASLIVVGTHGRRGLRRFFLGSVAEELVRVSHVPVAVVRRSHVELGVSGERSETGQLVSV